MKLNDFIHIYVTLNFITIRGGFSLLGKAFRRSQIKTLRRHLAQWLRTAGSETAGQQAQQCFNSGDDNRLRTRGSTRSLLTPLHSVQGL